MTKISGGELLVKALKAEGVKYVFGLPGGQLLNLLDALYCDQEMDFIMTRHEQSASFMADAWARITGLPGVCCGTVGPGATNLVTGVVDAYMDSIPILVITPNVRSYRSYPHMGSIQGLDQHALFKSITKWNSVVMRWDRIPELIHCAFRQALTGRPGPVHLDIPVDILGESHRELEHLPPETYRDVGRIRGDPIIIKRAVDILLRAEKPLLLAGGGVIRSEAWEEFLRIAEYLEIPLTATAMGAGAIPADHPLFVGDSGWMGGNGVFKAFKEADVVLAVGCRFSQWVGFGQPPIWKGKGQKIIHVDIDPQNIGRNVQVEVGIVGDAKTVLRDILSVIEKKTKKFSGTRGWVEELTDARRKFLVRFKEQTSSNNKPITGPRLVKEVRNFLDRDAILSFDGGSIADWAMAFVDIFEPRTKLFPAGNAPLGFGLPMAIAAKLAKFERQVCNITGDGAFLFTVQELETAVRYNLPIVTIVGNDRAFGDTKESQRLKFGERYIGVDFTDINYGNVAQAFNCYGERVEDPKEIKPALERAFESGKPAVIDIVIEYSPPPSKEWWNQ